MRRLKTALDRLESHWLGDVIGCLSLFGTLGVLLFFAEVLR
jgi:hypothetical protein